ncbi:hypothetical protein BOX15_Mlig027011g3, partial [Macrostomum lignano]
SLLWQAVSARSLRCLCRCPPARLMSQQQQQQDQDHEQHKHSQQQQQQEEDAKRRKKLAVLSCALTTSVFAGFYVWKESRLRQLEAQVTQGRVGSESSFGSSSVGRGGGQSDSALAVGGDFRLLDQRGRYVTRAELSGNSGWLLLYFGFCHCPDICPEQMEKMAEVVERLRLDKDPLRITPVFVSIDPERDTPALVKEYIADFSDKFIGLTGTKAEVDEVAKKYRVYYSKGPVDQDGDYIVDHAIIMYLVSPDGSVVDYYGQTKTPREIAGCIAKVVKSHRAA